MGSKFRCLGIIFFFFFSSFAAKAQKDLDFQYVDSLSYRYFMSGDWNNLIKLGNEAIEHSIDYKYLRQRLGLAFFSKGDYFKARKNFEKALSLDSYDTFTLTYLYYTYLNTLQADYAGYYAYKMPGDVRKSLAFKSFQPVESIDFEYNFKYAGTKLRSNPQYFHLGINSRLGPRLGLYQMFSNFKQTISIQGPRRTVDFKDQQPEYFALLKFTISPHWILKSAYHYLNTTFDTTNSNANLGFLGLSANFNRFNFEADVSVLRNEEFFVTQTGIQAGVIFSWNLNIYLTSSLSIKNEQNKNQFIFNQKGGYKLNNNVWIEGNFTFGNLTNYNDYDAMYVYNTIDPTTFRVGATVFFNTGKHIALWANLSYERKEFYENSLYYYNQFSYLGGIKWKL